MLKRIKLRMNNINNINEWFSYGYLVAIWPFVVIIILSSLCRCSVLWQRRAAKNGDSSVLLHGVELAGTQTTANGRQPSVRVSPGFLPACASRWPLCYFFRRIKLVNRLINFNKLMIVILLTNTPLPLRPGLADKPSCAEKSEQPFFIRSLALEAPPGIGPGNRGFADLCLTAWLWRRI